MFEPWLFVNNAIKKVLIIETTEVLAVDSP